MKKRFRRVILTITCLLSIFCSVAQSSTGYGQWKKMYFLDEFNDPMYEHPYIEAGLYNQYEHYFYIRFTPEHGGVFDFNLIEDFTHRRIKYESSESATIQVKKSNGVTETFIIPTEWINDGTLFLSPYDNLRFANAINAGNCKIRVTGVTTSSYPQTSSHVFTVNNQTKDFFNAAKNALGVNFSNNTGEGSQDNYVARNMAGFCGTYTLKGKIDGKYPVTMTLTFDYGEVTGTYYYDKYKIKNKIDGFLANLGPMTLTEYDGNKETGEYDGEFNGKVFRGEFVNYASGKRMSFLFNVVK